MCIGTGDVCLRVRTCVQVVSESKSVATGQAVSRPSRELGARCLHPEAGTNQPLQSGRIPGVPLWVSARRMTIQAKEMDFYLFLNTKEKSLLSLIRCHLKMKELYVLPFPTLPDSLQGGNRRLVSTQA